MPDPKVQLQAPALAPVVSRPLRTAASFVLVLPKRRVVYRHWDKERYLPGEEAELVLEGEGIGDQKYEFVVEKAASEEGPWEPVASLQAKVEGERASAKYKFPKAEPKGRLSKAEWKRASASPGDRLGLHVEAEGYEGGFLSIQVEKQKEDGSWDVYTRWQGTIEQGKYDGVFPVPPGEGARAGEASRGGQASGELQLERKIVELSFEQDPVEGGTAWMEARTENLDGSQLRFVLERADEVGTWVEVGSAVSTVTKGSARNSVAVPPPGPRGSTPARESQDPVRFAVARMHTHDQVVVSLDPGWLKGESYEVTLERRSLDGEGKWESVGAVVEQPAANGECVAQPSGRDPDAASGQESAGDGPEEQGEAVRADERELPAAETVQAAPGPGGAESHAAQPGAAQPEAQVQPASARPGPEPQRPHAAAATQAQPAPTPTSQAQPARQPETAQAQRPMAPPAWPAQPAPASPPLPGQPVPDRPAPHLQAAPAPAAPEAQTAPVRPTLEAPPPPPQTRPAEAAPARPAISVQAPPDHPRLATLPASDAPPVPASMNASLPVAPAASETPVPAVASGAPSSGASVAQVAAVAETPSGGRPGAERVPQGPGSPSGDPLSDALSKARDAKDKAKDAKSKLEKAQEFASDLAPPDEANVED